MVQAGNIGRRRSVLIEFRDYGATEVRLEHIAQWTAAAKNAALLQHIEVVEKCLISALTEMDKAVFRMNLSVWSAFSSRVVRPMNRAPTYYAP